MANLRRPGERARATKGGSIDERLAPLQPAARAPTRGRVRTLIEARRALGVPTSSEPAVLRAWGVPADGQLVAYPVFDRRQSDLLAEFACMRVITREGRRLVPRQPGTRAKLRELPNALWIVHGSVVLAADNTLVLGTLSIEPAFDGQLSHPRKDAALGITGELLRLIQPAQLLRQVAEQLQRSQHWHKLAQRLGARQPPARQQRVLETLQRAKTGRSRPPIPPNELAAIARRYAQLCQLGEHRPLPLLAAEFGITRNQARDRIYKARHLGLLTKTDRGRAGGRLRAKAVEG